MDPSRPPRTGLDSLPNEVLVCILDWLWSPDLVPLSLVSRHLRTVISRVLHRRILSCVTLEEHALVVQCSHPACPSDKPYMGVSYLGTDPLDRACEEDVDIMGNMGTMYSGFRLREHDSNFRLWTRRQNGRVVPGPKILPNELLALARLQQRTEGSESGEGGGSQAEGGVDANPETLPCHDIMMESYERFTQIRIRADLLSLNRSSGSLILADSYARLWRDWLPRRDLPQAQVDGGDLEQERQPAADDNTVPVTGDQHILWADLNKTLGLKVRVAEGNDALEQPFALPNYPMSPRYEVQFEELLVRTSRLLLATETAVKSGRGSQTAVFLGSVRVA